jgi:hypothetical protein
MGRSRNIKPAFFTNDALADLPFEVRLLFIGLWTLADKAGRLLDRPKKIKMELFAADNVDCNAGLSELQRARFLTRYEVGGDRYIQIHNWDKHQNPHKKEQDSVIPEIPVRDPENPVLAQPIPDRAGLIPDSGFLIPDSGFRIPDSGFKTPSAGVRKKPRTPPAAKVEAPTTATWAAYASAYRDRYRVDPVRNAKVNGQLAQLVARLGAEESPQVAAFFTRHNRSLYVSAKHPVDLLLRDAEGLRTEWATGMTVTESEARQTDRRQNTANVFATLISEERARKVADGK